MHLNKVSVKFLVLLLITSFIINLTGCFRFGQERLIIATTTSTYDSGLLDYILPFFMEKYDINADVVAVGTGQALAMGKRGDVDVLLVHSPEAEKEFMDQGNGALRKEIMYNHFVLLGSSEDEARVRDAGGAAEAFGKIAENQSFFISREDNSGTYLKELDIWEKAGINPTGEWYVENGSGMAETLRMAHEKMAYTLSDRSTFVTLKNNLDIEILLEKDEELKNIYSVIMVNPDKFPGTNHEGAENLIDFLSSPKGKDLVKNYGVEQYGQPLFFLID